MSKGISLPGALAALCAALALAGSGTSSARAPSLRAAAIPDVSVLFGRAVGIARHTSPPEYSKAVVLEADGITAGARCSAQGCGGGRGVSSATGVVGWRFVFDNAASRRPVLSATLMYGPPPHRFGRVIGYTMPFLEDVPIPKAPRMTLRRAVALLRRAGHSGRFFNVTLRSPLGPRASHPLFIFGLVRTSVAVDTVTGKVTVPRGG